MPHPQSALPQIARPCCGEQAEMNLVGSLQAGADELRRLQRELHALRSPCGCVAATIALLATAGAWSWYFLVAHPEQSAGARTAWMGAALAFGSAVLGKIIGILWARYRHAILSRRARSLLSASRAKAAGAA